MGRDWIIDVIADLRSFTRENDLPMLTAQLEEARLVAEVEIASVAANDMTAPRADSDLARGVPRKQRNPRRS